MTATLTRAVAAAALAALATACATVDPALDVADVRTTVSERRAGGAAFDVEEPAEEAVSARVRALLADPLTADRAVEVAFLRNRRLLGVLAEIGIARAELVQAGLLRNPILTASVRFGIGASGTGADLGLVQELLNVLQIPLKKRVAAAHLEATKLAAGAALLALAADVREAFYAAQAAEQQLALRRTVAEAAALGADLARRRHAAGSATDLDLATEAALHEDARLAVAEAEVEALEHREALTVRLGLFGAETAFTMGERLPALPERDRELAGLESISVERRLDLAAARQEIAAAGHEAAFARFYGLVPGGGLGAEAEREVEGGWSVGPAFELELPLFDQRQAEVAAARAKERREAEAFAALAVAIRSEVRVAHARLATARARVRHYERTVLPLRATILDETLREHNAMQVGVAALLLAKTGQVEAGSRYVTALADYWSARVALDRAVGAELPTDEQEEKR
jgi:cobalt-zinc-cadmium efflux system outer membrane protein